MDEKSAKDPYIKCIDKLGNVTKATLEGANKHFFDQQKKLIDYEMEAFNKKEAESDKRFNIAAKAILAENTLQFLSGLREIFKQN